MITKITLNKVASYKNPAILTLNKKVNLFYGLNGTGKTTLSNYLYQSGNSQYLNCSIDGLDASSTILVYNQTFIQENFFESNEQKGIFTLSKSNKDVEIAIQNAQNELTKLQEEIILKQSEVASIKNKLTDKSNNLRDILWEIKTKYSGGDRVLEFCLEGMMSRKDSLLEHVLKLAKPISKPIVSIDDLKNKMQSISGENSQKYTTLPNINFPMSNIEEHIIFSKEIVGNENSSVATLIKMLKNSDWVKEGLKYLPANQMQENSSCPFCQEKTISKLLIENLKNYFDESYEADIRQLKVFLDVYQNAIKTIPSKSTFDVNPIFESLKKDFEIKYSAFMNIIENNKRLIGDKVNNASSSVTLLRSDIALQELNEVINKINSSIVEHNTNIEQSQKLRNSIKITFWEIMRWEYDTLINNFIIQLNQAQADEKKLNQSIHDYYNNISEKKLFIAEQQKKTVNIDEAIDKINTGLIDLGITDFKISKNHDDKYKIIRNDSESEVFRSLSEGEKMIISFLYFLELCRGKQNATDVNTKKIVVIDDPISSLSHIYVFNIGRLIKNEFFGEKDGESIKYKYEQVIILTHSLYFFYEITEIKHDLRESEQDLFRIVKNENGTKFVSMKYEEIQNDYQAYWSVIKDENQPPALIANCMRNIIEYFFNFIEKKDLNNFFQNKALQTVRFQSFYRYINRESHSLGQNIFDYKEYNYNDFKDGLAELFKVTGYEAHYKKMMKK